MCSIPSKVQLAPFTISSNGTSIVTLRLLLSPMEMITGTIASVSPTPFRSLSRPLDDVSDCSSVTKPLVVDSPVEDDVINLDGIDLPVARHPRWEPGFKLTELFVRCWFSVEDAEELPSGEEHKLGDLVLSAGKLISLGLSVTLSRRLTLTVVTGHPLSEPDVCFTDDWKSKGEKLFSSYTYIVQVTLTSFQLVPRTSPLTFGLRQEI